MHQPNSKLSALVVFCYLCLSVLLPLQHTDELAPPNAASTQVSTTQRRAVRIGLNIPQQTQTNLRCQEHCAACDWQAAQLSAALPAFTLALTPPQTLRVVTTFPRYLRLLTFPASSRAPPLV
jgi:hypothetical protein